MPHLTDEERAAIEAFKIPVDSFNPGTYWIASIDSESVMPSEAELRMIRSYIDYAIRATYNETYQARILAKPFPAEGGHVTKIFRKGSKWLEQEPLYERNGEVTNVFHGDARLVNGGDPREGWVYRRITWDGGLYWPQWPKPRQTLIEVLDHINGPEPFEPWERWKREHPEVFQ